MIYWMYIGTFYLFWLSWQDLTRQRFVDDRKNYFMLGVTVSLWWSVAGGRVWWYGLSLVAVIMLFNIIAKRHEQVIGLADIHTLSWILLGLGIINPSYGLLWTIIFGVLCLVMYLVRLASYHHLPREQWTPSPFYPVITASYILFGIMAGLY